MMTKIIFIIFLACYLTPSSASDKFISKLTNELRTTNADTVSKNLSNRWDEEMVPFLRGTALCKPGYVEAMVSLLGTNNSTALQAYGETLESAMLRCPRRVLGNIAEPHVTIACSVGSLTDLDSKAKLDTQIKKVTRIKDSKMAPKIRMCLDAYMSELNRFD